MADATRRSGRIPKQVAILLIGSDIEGRIFSERTKTVVLSRHGAGIISEYKLSAEQELVIRSVESNKEAEVRVVGQIGSAGDTYIYGVAFLHADRQPDSNFWGLEFPPLSEDEKRASHTLLECSKCHMREAADHSDLESDVYAVNESIMRHCKRCGSSTLWKQPTGELSEQELAPTPVAPAPRAGVWQPDASSAASSFGEQAVPSGPNAPWAPARPSLGADAQRSIAQKDGGVSRGNERRQANSTGVSEAEPAAPAKQVHSKDKDNRRKHARTRVNFKACIRRADAPNDVVACEDMSRGGIRFKSSKKYVEKALIEVAVPYTAGDSAIFVPAQIAWVMELPEQKMWRCGATYLRGGK